MIAEIIQQTLLIPIITLVITLKSGGILLNLSEPSNQQLAAKGKLLATAMVIAWLVSVYAIVGLPSIPMKQAQDWWWLLLTAGLINRFYMPKNYQKYLWALIVLFGALVMLMPIFRYQEYSVFTWAVVAAYILISIVTAINTCNVANIPKQVSTPIAAISTFCMFAGIIALTSGSLLLAMLCFSLCVSATFTGIISHYCKVAFNSYLPVISVVFSLLVLQIWQFVEVNEITIFMLLVGYGCLFLPKLSKSTQIMLASVFLFIGLSYLAYLTLVADVNQLERYL